jgi:hypothetical protein
MAPSLQWSHAYSAEAKAKLWQAFTCTSTSDKIIREHAKRNISETSFGMFAEAKPDQFFRAAGQHRKTRGLTQYTWHSSSWETQHFVRLYIACRSSSQAEQLLCNSTFQSNLLLEEPSPLEVVEDITLEDTECPRSLADNDEDNFIVLPSPPVEPATENLDKSSSNDVPSSKIYLIVIMVLAYYQAVGS